MRSKLVVILFLLFTLFSISGNELSVSLHHYTADCYDSTRGLPQNSIRAIVRDSDGYVYFGTQEGLVIFNGEQMQIINHRSDSSLLSDDIRALLMQKNGELLVGTTRGIYRLKDRRIVPDSGDLQEFFITTLAQGPDGSLWIGTDNHGVFHRKKDDTLQSYTVNKNNIYSNHINTLFVTESGAVYCGTSEGVEYFDTSQFRKIEKIYWPVFSISGTKDKLWLATGGGLAIIKNNAYDYLYTKEDGLSTNGIKSVMARKNEEVWVGLENGGIGRFLHGKFSELKSVNRQKIGAIITLFQDKYDTIWLGTESRGFCLFHKGAVYHPGIDYNDIRSITTNGTGSLWAASAKNGLLQLPANGQARWFTTVDGLRSNILSNVFMDNNNRLWIGTQHNGIQILEDNKFLDLDTITQDFTAAFPVSARVFFQDSRGVMWFADRSSLTPVFSWKDGALTPYSLPDTKQTVRAIGETKTDQLIVITGNGVLYEFNRAEKKFQLYKTLKVTSSVISLFIDDSNRMLILTAEAGLIILEGEKQIYLSEKEGMYDNSAHAVITDQNGDYWFTSNSGVFTISKKSIEDFLAKKVTKVSFRLFKESDGMTTSECNGGAQPSLTLAANGTILIPTVRGIVSIDPNSLSALPMKPTVHVESVKSGNDELMLQNDKQSQLQTVTVPIDNRNIAVAYTSLSFLHRGRIIYKYKLSQVDKIWRNARMRTTAYYTNLAPGEYLLTLQASYIDYPELLGTTTLRIIVPGYFWEMIWFRVGSLFALLFFAVLMVHLRMEAHKKTAARLTVLVHEKTNELRIKNEELKQAALQDGITGMLNRRYLFEIEKPKIEAYLHRLNWILEDNDRRGDKPPTTIYAAFLISIDDFTALADEYGHEATDLLMKKVAQLIYTHIRKEDLILRWSDTKFLVILKNSEPNYIPLFAKKIQNLIAQTPFELSKTKPNPDVSLNIGIVHFPFCPGEPIRVSCEQTLLFADFAAFRAKQEGKGISLILAPTDGKTLKEISFDEKASDLFAAGYISTTSV